MRHERTLVKRFPSRWREIIALCEQDEAFRALCADYDEANRAAKIWSNSRKDPARFEEYLEVARQLEAEILDEIRKIESPPSVGKTRRD